jgi:hypothetical protein
MSGKKIIRSILIILNWDPVRAKRGNRRSLHFWQPEHLAAAPTCPQYTGADRQRNRGDDFRNRSREDRSRFDGDRQRDFARDRNPAISMISEAREIEWEISDRIVIDHNAK